MTEPQVTLFDPSETGVDVPDTAGDGDVVQPVNILAARVKAQKGKAGLASDPPALPDDAVLGDDGDGVLTDQARDELAKLAARNGETTSADQPGDVMDGLAGESLYDQRQRELAAARERPGGKKSPKAAKGKKGSGATTKSAKDKAAEAKAKAKEKSDKAKARDADKAAKAKQVATDKKAREDERKRKVEEERKRKADERAAKRTPNVIGRENKSVQAAFAEDYAKAGPKTDKNPDGLGIRRAKADRGDFAAGYVMALRRLRKSKGAETGE